jgi:integrase
MALYKRGEIWWARLWHRGRELRRSTGLRDRAAAKRKHDEIAARIWHEKQTGRQFSEALALWVKAAPRSRPELRTVRQIIRLYRDRPIGAVTAASIQDTFGDKKPGTYNRLVNIIRAALNLAVHAEWLASAPKLPRRKEPPRDPRFITAEEWARLRDELPLHLRTMADFAIATGLRWANVSGLEWRRVSIERKLVWIPATQAKGGKAIPVPLSVAAIEALQRVKGRREGFVFTYRGKPIQSPKSGWLAAVRRADLPGFRWHDLRHTWASWHVQAGTPLAVLQKLGGWASMDMVLRYAFLAPDHLAAYADNAAPVKRTHKNPHNRETKAA